MKKTLLSLLLAATCSLSSLAARPLEPMTKAVLQAYSDILVENPKDYETLLRRGMQYYDVGYYDEALTDTRKALELMPSGEKELRADALQLLSEILALEKDYPAAADAVRKALDIRRNDYKLLNRLGDFCILSNDIDGANSAFLAMQRLQSQSPEALIGLARVDIARGKYDDALAKMQRAEEFNSTLWTTCHSVGNLMLQMDQPKEAATQFIKAIALADGQQLPLQSLLNLSHSNYAAVKEAVTEASAKAPESAAMPLLLANVAFEAGQYPEAIQALNRVMTHNQGRVPSVYSLMAESMLANGQQTDALDFASRAVASDPKAAYLCVQARAQEASGNPLQAISILSEALKREPANVEALLYKGLLTAAQGNPTNALPLIRQAVALDNDNIYALVLAGLVSETLQEKEEAFRNFAAATRIDAETEAQIACKGVAQTKSGRVLDADATLRSLIAKATPDALYWAAVAYANTGNKERSQTLTKQAQDAGFANHYLLQNASGPMTLRP